MLDAVRIMPYEGKEPYIFISYSHRDSSTVLPVIRALVDLGFRIWYDDGIDPGSEWPESIAAHLSGCSVCIAFISPNYIVSNNCKRELNFALSRNKGFISVILSEMELTPGMEMQISTYQSLMKYRYLSEKDFIDKLSDADILIPCRKPANESVSSRREADIETDAVIPQITEPLSEYLTLTTETISIEKPASDSQLVTEANTNRDQTAKRKQEKKKHTKKSRIKADVPYKKTIKVITTSVIAVISAIVLLSVLLITKPFKKRVKIGETEFENGEYIRIENAQLSSSQLKSITALDKTSLIVFENCSFENKAIDQLAVLSEVRNFSLKNCTGITDLDFISSFDSLYSLTISGCGVTDKMISSGTIPSSVTELDLSGNSLTKIPELDQLTKLIKLNIGYNNISDITALSNTVNLKELYINDNNISDISVLDNYIYLTHIDLSRNSISSLSPLSHCSILKVFRSAGNSMLADADLEIIEKNSETLQIIDISNTGVQDLNRLSKCINLIKLNISNCTVSDINPVSGMVHLETLKASNCQIEDMKPLSSCKELKYINLSGNKITSVAGLGDNESIDVLLLNNNKISDISGLSVKSKYLILSLYGNPIKKAAALSQLSGSYLITEYLESYKQVDLSNFYYLYITDVDIDNKLELENRYGYSIEYVDADEAVSIAADKSYLQARDIIYD